MWLEKLLVCCVGVFHSICGVFKCDFYGIDVTDESGGRVGSETIVESRFSNEGLVCGAFVRGLRRRGFVRDLSRCSD